MTHRLLALRSLVVLVACTGLCLSLALPDPGDELERTRPDLPAAMNDLAQAFRELEQGLAQGGSGSVDEAAREMSAAAGRLVRIAAGDVAQLGAGAPSAAEKLVRLADEVARLHAADRVPGATQAFGELRSTCVACHVRLRDEGGERSLYPALRGTVAGRVSLTDVDGTLVEDRSRVLIFLESRDPSSGWRNHRDPPEISQRGREFRPRLLPVVQGTTVRFPNDDLVFHNVFSLSKSRPFDLGIYKQGESRELRFEDAGLIKVYCNIHPEMAASIVVLPNPWFTLCDEDGSFVIADVPEGTYRLRAWTEMGADEALEVELLESRVRRLEFGLRETQEPSPHKNKFGREYPSKY